MYDSAHANVPPLLTLSMIVDVALSKPAVVAVLLFTCTVRPWFVYAYCLSVLNECLGKYSVSAWKYTMYFHFEMPERLHE